MNKKSITKLSIFTLIIASLLFVGCGKTVEPTESALAYFDLYEKHEINKETLPLTEEEAKKVMDESMTLSIAEFRKDLSDIDLSRVSDDRLKALIKKNIESDKKITPKAEEVSKTGDTAVVKLSAKPINPAAYEKSSDEKFSKLTEKDLENPEAILKIMEETLDEMIKNPVYTDKEESIEVTLKKVDNKWIIYSDEELKKFDKLTVIE